MRRSLPADWCRGSVSWQTCGWDVTLSVSLHSPENQRRSEIMPVNRRYPVEELLDACPATTSTPPADVVTIEYAVINGVEQHQGRCPASWPGGSAECSAM